MTIAIARIVLAALLALACVPASAQEARPKKPASIEERTQDKDRREADLKAIEGSIKQSDEEKQRAIKAVESLRGDRAKLNKDLIDTTRRVRATDEKLSLIEGRVSVLELQENALKASLEARRDVMIEVLAALQRMSRKPPPAVLVRPNDMLEAVRASIMLGAVLPEMRNEAEQLAADLKGLVENRQAQATERDALLREKQAIAADRERLAALVSARQGQIDASEQQLREERQKITLLAKQAQSLKELITRMESDIANASRAAEAAKKVPLPTGQNQQISALPGGNLKDAGRLAPKFAFADLKGALPLPTAGEVVKTFGMPDGFGSTEKGITITPPSGAIISAPNDGWVAFSGPYRSYGQVLIINAGSGYHMLLIGVDHALVEVGQFVLQGEPIAVMASSLQGTGLQAGGLRGANGRQASSSQNRDSPDRDLPNRDLPIKGSSLYIELRKDGQPIDSSPWWAQATNEKARG